MRAASGSTWVEVTPSPAFPGSRRSNIVCDGNYPGRDGRRERPRWLSWTSTSIMPRLRLHGETVGATVLRATGQALRDAADGSASVYALGGDRFVVLLPGVVEEGAASWAERARATLAELEFPVKGQTLRIAASCGVAGRRRGRGFGKTDLERLGGAPLGKVVRAGLRGAVRRIRRGSQRWTMLWRRFKLLQDSVARDIFMPMRLGTARPTTGSPKSAGLFRRTRLPAFPVVDAKGEVVGTSHRRCGSRQHHLGRRRKGGRRDVRRRDNVRRADGFPHAPSILRTTSGGGRDRRARWETYGPAHRDSLVTPVDSTEKHPAAEGAADC